MKYTQTLLFMAVMQASYGWAGAGHDHHHSAEAPNSAEASSSAEASTGATGSRPWRLDVQLGYQDVAEPVVPGFLSWNGHRRKAGFALQHLDLGRAFQWSEYELDGRFTLSLHDNQVELHEAWVRQSLNEQWQWQAGKVLVDIGLQNTRHSHDRTFVDQPLYQNALWGGELSEAAANLSWHQAWSQHWRVSAVAGLLSTEQQQTEKSSGAGLVNLVLSYQNHGLTARFKADVYQAQVNQRGLTLFAFDSNSHTHGSGATEYFDGVMRHQALALEVDWSGNWGTLALASEYQQRTESGELYSAAGQTTDATADAELESWGGYGSLSWRLPDSVVPLELAFRQQWLGSDVALTNPATRDLDNSLLNQQGTLPQGRSYLVRWHRQNGSLALQYNQWDDDNLALPEWIVSGYYGVAF